VAVPGYEEVVRVDDPASGLRAVVAVHSTRLGPSLGGTRFKPYASEDDALADALRLARAMSYKSAVAGIDVGGGKGVIIGDPATEKTPALLHAYGRFIDTLEGRYVTAPDVGTTEADMAVIRDATSHVTGLAPALGGLGDPSPPTARGLVAALRGLQRFRGAPLEGLHVAISGAGKVGGDLARQLLALGCRVTVADVDRAKAEATGGEVADPAGIHRTMCDVFAPCALGGVLDEVTVPELRCGAVVGAANNQLARPDVARLLQDRGVVYVPDYVANAGGIVLVAEELHHGTAEHAEPLVQRIESTVVRVLERAAQDGGTPLDAADAIAEERLG
jgi:valine dehydrogenase (NAD+)